MTQELAPEPVGRTDDRAPFVVLAFVGGALLGGANAVAIRISLRELQGSPLWAAFLRFALAAAVLGLVMAARRARFPRLRELRGVVLYGVLVFGGAYACLFLALRDIQAGALQLVGALVPLATLVLAALQRQERLHRAAVGGALLALAGVVVVSRASLGGPLPLPALLAGLGAVLCFAQGTVVAHRYPSVDAVTTNAVGMATGAVVLLVGALLRREPLVAPGAAATWWSLGYLALVGSIVVFWLYLVVLRRWSASRAAYGFLLVPVSTLLLSAWLDDERLGGATAIGGALVLGGVWVGALRPDRSVRVRDDGARGRDDGT